MKDADRAGSPSSSPSSPDNAPADDLPLFDGGALGGSTSGKMGSTTAGVSGKMSEPSPSLGSFNLQSFTTSLKARRWLGTMRSPPRFLGTSNFSMPSGKDDAMSRLQINTQYFFTNYILVTLALVAWFILSDFRLMLLLGALVYAYMKVAAVDPLKLGPVELAGNKRFFALYGVGGFLVLVIAGSTLFLVVVGCSAATLVHALFHGTIGVEELDTAQYQAVPTSDAGFGQMV